MTPCQTIGVGACCRRHSGSRVASPYRLKMLVNMRGGGTGALVFTEQNDAPQTRATLGTRTLSSLLSSATRFESGTLPANDEFRKLLEGSSRAGGARPKALVHDDDGEWIAKFPSASRDGAYDVWALKRCAWSWRNVPDCRCRSRVCRTWDASGCCWFAASTSHHREGAFTWSACGRSAKNGPDCSSRAIPIWPAPWAILRCTGRRRGNAVPTHDPSTLRSET